MVGTDVYMLVPYKVAPYKTEIVYSHKHYCSQWVQGLRKY